MERERASHAKAAQRHVVKKARLEQGVLPESKFDDVGDIVRPVRRLQNLPSEILLNIFLNIGPGKCLLDLCRLYPPFLTVASSVFVEYLEIEIWEPDPLNRRSKPPSFSQEQLSRTRGIAVISKPRPARSLSLARWAEKITGVNLYVQHTIEQLDTQRLRSFCWRLEIPISMETIKLLHERHSRSLIRLDISCDLLMAELNTARCNFPYLEELHLSCHFLKFGEQEWLCTTRLRSLTLDSRGGVRLGQALQMLTQSNRPDGIPLPAKLELESLTLGHLLLPYNVVELKKLPVNWHTIKRLSVRQGVFAPEFLLSLADLSKERPLSLEELWVKGEPGVRTTTSNALARLCGVILKLKSLAFIRQSTRPDDSDVGDLINGKHLNVLVSDLGLGIMQLGTYGTARNISETMTLSQKHDLRELACLIDFHPISGLSDITAIAQLSQLRTLHIRNPPKFPYNLRTLNGRVPVETIRCAENLLRRIRQCAVEIDSSSDEESSTNARQAPYLNLLCIGCWDERDYRACDRVRGWNMEPHALTKTCGTRKSRMGQRYWIPVFFRVAWIEKDDEENMGRDVWVPKVDVITKVAFKGVNAISTDVKCFEAYW